MRRFAARINAERQQALGISRYIWRSRDDARVREAHEAHDDRVFDWEDPPQGGHPGEAWGCRCHAEPLIEDPGDWQPLSGLALRRLTIAAELDGMGAAAGDFAAGIVEGISELPARAAWPMPSCYERDSSRLGMTATAINAARRSKH